MNEIDLAVCNKQAELCFIGSLFKSPELYISYGNLIKSKYDFSDAATCFFYDLFENCYLTFTQDMSKGKVDNYASQNQETFRQYKQYGGWKSIAEMCNVADPNDCKNYFSIVKKMSLLREYKKQGFNVDKILAYKNFAKLTANDVYRMVRSQCDKIHTNVQVQDSPIIITEKTDSLIESFLKTPQFGVPSLFKGYDEYFRGYLSETVMFTGQLSNEGKSRLLCLQMLYVVACQKRKVMLLSTEMTELATRSCLITTALNNSCFIEMHGVRMRKNEKEITLGLYRDDKTGEFIERKRDVVTGEYLETEEDYIKRVHQTREYKNVAKVAKWLSDQIDGKLYFHDITTDYSWEAIELEVRRAKLLYNCDIVALDTMKCWGIEEWSAMKLLATNLVQLCKELRIFGYATFQLTDDTAFMDIMSLTSNNIGASKGIKHPADIILLGKRINRDEYDKYRYIPWEDVDAWGEIVPRELNSDKLYFAQKIDKNRLSDKSVLLFEYDLNYNTWDNVGKLIQNTNAYGSYDGSQRKKRV